MKQKDGLISQKNVR